jgi:chemotaxis protein methyltransferase CheR
MITRETMKFLISSLYKESGLVLDESKDYLLESRLEPLAIQEGFSSLEDFGKHVMKCPSPLLLQKVVEAMTTNETSFFRDRIPFDIFKNVILPKMVKGNEKRRKLRIWSACCSTGQEPYTISMLLSDFEANIQQWDVKIIATDIDKTVLNRAREGSYSQYEVQRGLPILYLTRYFTQTDGSWVVKPTVKKRVEFTQLNLLSDFTFFGMFDLIFCRNVLIYFDLPTKKKILEQMARMLSPAGVLFLGSSETSIGVTEKLVRVEVEKGTYYKKA